MPVTSSQAVQQLAITNELPGLSKLERGEISFIFCGMGPQWFAMGRELINTEPVFRSIVAEIDHELRKAGTYILTIDEMNKI